MCVRVNNVRTIKNLLASLIETAVQSVLEPGSCSDIEHDVIPVGETPSTSSTSDQNGKSFSAGQLAKLGEGFFTTVEIF